MSSKCQPENLTKSWFALTNQLDPKKQGRDRQVSKVTPT
jgi:hypothetical protein